MGRRRGDGEVNDCAIRESSAGHVILLVREALAGRGFLRRVWIWFLSEGGTFVLSQDPRSCRGPRRELAHPDPPKGVSSNVRRLGVCTKEVSRADGSASRGSFESLPLSSAPIPRPPALPR